MRARYYWPPKPGEEPNLDRLEKEWTALENRLSSPGGSTAASGIAKLARQVSLRPQGATAAVSDRELVEALPAVREAIRLMEQIYLRTGFGRDDRSASNRLYMGWFNRFGVWATAPTFRAWWPWLAPFHSGDFVDFMQGVPEFGLWPTVPRGEKRVLAPTLELKTLGEEKPVPTKTAAEDAGAKPEADDTTTTAAPKSALPPVVLEKRPEPSGGYARSRFEARSRDAEATAEPAPEERIYELELAMPATETRLNAAVLRMTVEAPTVEGKRGKIARWRPEDLYVPPGLWALGVGERFVTVLREELPQKEGVVRIEVETSKEPSISQDALYTGAGFRRTSDGGFILDLVEDSPGKERAHTKKSG